MSGKQEKGILQPSDRKAIEHLILGAAPERHLDLDKIWKKYDPIFWCMEDTVGFKLEAKGKNVNFQHKTTEIFWILGFAAWNAVILHVPHIYAHLLTGARLDKSLLEQDQGLSEAEAAFENLLYCIQCAQRVVSVAEMEWPAGVPELTNDRSSLEHEMQATYDLILIALAYAFLHEIRHVMYYVDGDAPAKQADEELECDKFARNFIMAKAADYADNGDVPVEKILGKRAAGVTLGAFVVYEISDDSIRAGGYLYPPIADRIDALVNQNNLPESSILWDYAATLLVGIVRRRNRNLSLKAKSFKEMCPLLINELRSLHI